MNSATTTAMAATTTTSDTSAATPRGTLRSSRKLVSGLQT